MKVITTIAEHQQNKRINAMKDYFSEVLAAVNGFDTALKSWETWGTQPRSASHKNSYGTIVLNNVPFSRYELFLNNLQTLRAFRHNQHHRIFVHS
jgi:hypothetical protein